LGNSVVGVLAHRQGLRGLYGRLGEVTDEAMVVASGDVEVQVQVSSLDSVLVMNISRTASQRSLRARLKAAEGSFGRSVPEDNSGPGEWILVGLFSGVGVLTLDDVHIVLESLVEYDVGLGEEEAVTVGGVV